MFSPIPPTKTGPFCELSSVDSFISFFIHPRFKSSCRVHVLVKIAHAEPTVNAPLINVAVLKRRNLAVEEKLKRLKRRNDS
ncbi:hypothetical protein CAEBREN_10894 [Caenorhabditis brenneri]|uniref:Uncharacterized protein n=1 Tax=Caenorhabditis brenneri TaxID=135651 RepID=G0MXZ6_CAEBE|nr:hypothetical protein CAEBREN_10894 [Caenorhabditis brenneri]